MRFQDVFSIDTLMSLNTKKSNNTFKGNKQLHITAFWHKRSF